MKKIYIFTAVLALLTLSLNAQIDTQAKAKPLSKTQVATFNFNKMLRGIKGMESILSVSGQANGQFRAPLRYDADLFNTLGPFTGDNFDYGIGFPEAYPEGPQDILVTTVLNRSEYESHIGEEIVGFRFALWGDATKTVKVADFITYPMNSNSGFDQNHLYEWTLADLEGNEPPSDDPVETTKYVKVTSSDDLTSGEYLIVCETQNVIFDGSVSGSTLNGANYATAPTISNNAIEYTVDLDAKDFTIDMSNGTIKSASGYYIGCENTNNAISYNQNTQYTNTITVNSGTASIIYRYNNANRPLKCNTQNNVFRYYKTTSSNVADIQLYKKVAVTRGKKVNRRANRAETLLTGWDAATDARTFPSTWTVPNVGGDGDFTNSYWFSGSTGGTFTIPASDLQGCATVTVKIVAGKENSSTHSISVNGTSKALTQSLEEYVWENVSGSNNITITYSDYYVDISSIKVYGEVGDSNEGYVELVPGQWHEFYLDQPVEFQVENDDDQLFMGYWYKQYPLSSQNDEVMNPAAVNSESTGHSHYVNMVAGSAGAGDLVISLPYSMNIRAITVYDTNGNTLTGWNAITAYNNSDYTSVSLDGSTYAAYNLPTGWSISDGNYFLSWNNSSYGRLGYLLGDDDLTIASSALNGNTTVRVVMNVYDDNGSGTISINGESKTISGSPLADYTWNNVDLSATVYNRSWFNPDFSEVGDLAVQLIFKTTKPTPEAPTVTPATGDANVTITISPDEETDGQLVYYVVYNGSQTQDLTFPRGANDYTVEVHAYTTATSNYNQSPEAVVTVTIPALPQTPAPTIAISSENDEEVTITATGNGTVTLTINGQTVQGNGSASITLPRHITDYVVTATATAQVNGELVSTTTTEEITIESMTTAGGWLPIEGTYTGDEPISLIDEATHKLIKFEDHFSASTMYNAHADQYDYIIREENNPKTSNTVTIPVFKTHSIMNGLYTEAEVLADDKYDENKLTANALNSKMTFDTQNANEMYRYQLYRGELNENPVIDLNHTISQLQESGDLFTEQLTIDGISPMVEHAPAGTVVRNDRCFFFNNNSTIAGPFTQENPYNVENADELAYVPVIWTMGFRTGRLDDLNNSYGSDIKRNVLNGANVITTVIKNEGGTNKFKVEGSNLDYYVYAPEITIDAKFPAYPQANDGDGYTYEPYMYRVWCTYTDAHAYSHLDNPDGHTRSLVDAGVIPAPFLIGEVKVADLPAGYPDPAHVVVGGSVPSGADWADYPWSFGAPKNTAGQFEFVIRYYYKKVVTDAAPSTSGLRGNRDGEDYYVFETKGSADNIVTGVNELWSGYGKVVISQTYVNAQGMQSDKPFDGLNIVVTRYSDGTTTTTKVVR